MVVVEADVDGRDGRPLVENDRDGGAREGEPACAWAARSELACAVVVVMLWGETREDLPSITSTRMDNAASAGKWNSRNLMQEAKIAKQPKKGASHHAAFATSEKGGRGDG